MCYFYLHSAKYKQMIFQIPGLANVRSSSRNFYQNFKGFLAKRAKEILIDEKNFPPMSHRFTAVYSRNKEYL